MKREGQGLTSKSISRKDIFLMLMWKKHIPKQNRMQGFLKLLNIPMMIIL